MGGDAEAADAGVRHQQHPADALLPEQAGQQVRPRQDLGPAVGEKGDGQVKNSLKGSAVDLLDGMHTHMGSSVEQICSKFRAMTPRAR